MCPQARLRYVATEKLHVVANGLVFTCSQQINCTSLPTPFLSYGVSRFLSGETGGMRT
jgi:hypothetical protein